MRKFYKIAAFILAVTITLVTLTSNGTKEFGGGKDLIEELYNQAAKQNDALKSIEEGIGKFRKNKIDAIAEYNSFTNYNNQYYSEAKTKAARIADAATKQKANDIINKSEAGYNTKIADWQNTLSQLNAKERELNDLLALLQILTTEPIIAKYQNSDFPNDSKIKEVNSELLKVIEKIKVITK